MKYVDGFVLVVAKKKLAAYRKLAREGAAVWKEYGALEYVECAGDDLDVKWGIPFPRLLKLKSSETAVFSWIVYKSRAQRDRINARIMKDPRFAGMDPESMPFDVKRMTSGGFKVLVES
ncbi:MAG: signal recognition particle [Candidatus Aminicenantes bacterium]|nr:signal recognition particle [Candidatus Aminicenantes bacterium]